jgi:hypothetical protein
VGTGETPPDSVASAGREPYFQPFVGDAYEAHPGLPGKLLIVGESHYLRKPEDDTPDFTIRVLQSVVADHMMRGWQTPLFRNLFYLVTGERNRAVSQEQWNRFWNAVAFYNYCQTRRLTRPLMRPVRHEWEASREPFKGVVSRLRPNFVFISGYHVSGHATALSGSVVTAENDGVWLPVGNSRYALARGIYHPSSRQYRRAPEQTREIVQRFLSAERLGDAPIVAAV